MTAPTLLTSRPSTPMHLLYAKAALTLLYFRVRLFTQTLLFCAVSQSVRGGAAWAAAVARYAAAPSSLLYVVLGPNAPDKLLLNSFTLPSPAAGSVGPLHARRFTRRTFLIYTLALQPAAQNTLSERASGCTSPPPSPSRRLNLNQRFPERARSLVRPSVCRL